MSKTTENTPSNPGDPGEVERLRNHNTELLAELKAAKAKATALQGQLTVAFEDRDAAMADVRALRLAPVSDLLEHIAAPGTSDLLGRMLYERGIRFDLEGDEIVVRDAEGNPAMVIDPAASKSAPASKPRPAKFDKKDLTLLMTEEGLPEAERHALAQAFPRFIVGSHASGGGSTGGAGATATTPPAKPAAKPSAPRAFGLS